jgi:hypothetical protein
MTKPALPAWFTSTVASAELSLCGLPAEVTAEVELCDPLDGLTAEVMRAIPPQAGFHADAARQAL